MATLSNTDLELATQGYLGFIDRREVGQDLAYCLQDAARYTGPDGVYLGDDGFRYFG